MLIVVIIFGVDVMFVVNSWLFVNLNYIFVFVFVGFLYFIFCFLLVNLVRKMEEKNKKVYSR